MSRSALVMYNRCLNMTWFGYAPRTLSTGAHLAHGTRFFTSMAEAHDADVSFRGSSAGDSWSAASASTSTWQQRVKVNPPLVQHVHCLSGLRVVKTGDSQKVAVGALIAFVDVHVHLFQ